MKCRMVSHYIAAAALLGGFPLNDGGAAARHFLNIFAAFRESVGLPIDFAALVDEDDEEAARVSMEEIGEFLAFLEYYVRIPQAMEHYKAVRAYQCHGIDLDSVEPVGRA